MNTKDSEQIATSQAAPNRRRQYIVDPAFQWRHAITIALTVFLITSIMSSVLYGLLHQQARMRFVHPQTYTAEVTLVVLFAALGFSVVTAGGVGLWSLSATQRICGPLYVLESCLTELCKGRLPAVRPLRRKDEFKGLYRSFARAMETLKSQKQAELNTLTDALARAQGALDGDGNQRRDLELLVRQLAKLQRDAAEALSVDLEEPGDGPVERRQAPSRATVGAA